jgi:drug/metabolite transporter (DMT)-like permease
MFPALLTTLLFSISAIFGRRTTAVMGGTEANFWRLSVATLFLALWGEFHGVGLRGPAFPMFFASGLVGFGVADLALFQALPRLGSRVTILLVHCLAAPFASITEWLWLGTTLTIPQMACGAVILIGVVVGLAPGKKSVLTKAELTVGLVFGVIAGFGQGWGAVLSRKAYQISAANGFKIDGINAAYQRILGGVIATGIVLLILRAKNVGRMLGEGSWSLSTKPSAAKWREGGLWVVLNALAGPTLGVSCYQWALQTAPTGIVLPIVATTPLVVIPFAHLWEDDAVHWRAIAGGVIAVVGVAALTLLKPR